MTTKEEIVFSPIETFMVGGARLVHFITTHNDVTYIAHAADFDERKNPELHALFTVSSIGYLRIRQKGVWMDYHKFYIVKDEVTGRDVWELRNEKYEMVFQPKRGMDLLMSEVVTFDHLYKTGVLKLDGQ